MITIFKLPPADLTVVQLVAWLQQAARSAPNQWEREHSISLLDDLGDVVTYYLTAKKADETHLPQQ